MKTLQLSMNYILHRKLNSFLCILLLTVGIATLTTATLIYKNIENNIQNNVRNIDLVVGAKGSPIQVILSTVYHIDIPTGNIPLTEAQKLMQNPEMKLAVPISLGDNFQNFRIVGTNGDFLKIYNAKLKEGSPVKDHFDVVIGSNVAKRTHLKIGDKFAGFHGLVMSDDEHKDFPYKVVGIIEETGTVLDRLIVTTLDAVWIIHEHPDEDEAEEHNHMVASGQYHREVTAVLLKFRSPLMAMKLPRTINKETNMQAASPAWETTRIMSILGVGIDSLKFFGAVLIMSSFLSIFIALLNSISERKYDIAILRAMGKSKNYIFKLVIFEGLLITLDGLISGILLGHVIAYIIAAASAELSGFGLSGGKFFSEELYYAMAVIVFSLIASIIPAIKAYRTDVSQTLSDSRI